MRRPGCADIVLRSGRLNPAMDRWLQTQGLTRAHVITACNPYSRRCSDRSNAQANQSLQQRLQALQVVILPAINQPRHGDWPAEPGFLLAGLSDREVLALASEFRQHAVLAHGRSQPSRLLYSAAGPDQLATTR